jgi:hypothetical protein
VRNSRDFEEIFWWKGDSLVALLKELVDRLVDSGVLVSGLSIRSRGLLSLITRDRH